MLERQTLLNTTEACMIRQGLQLELHHSCKARISPDCSGELTYPRRHGYKLLVPRAPCMLYNNECPYAVADCQYDSNRATDAPPCPAPWMPIRPNQCLTSTVRNACPPSPSHSGLVQVPCARSRVSTEVNDCPVCSDGCVWAGVVVSAVHCHDPTHRWWKTACKSSLNACILLPSAAKHESTRSNQVSPKRCLCSAPDVAPP